jgi:wobble nucleotide-excising tRNase
VDDFCALQPRTGIDTAIGAAGRALAAAQEQESIRAAQSLAAVTLPDFDAAAIAAVVARDLPAPDAAAAAQVQAHLGNIGYGGESWVAEGMQRLPAAAHEGDTSACAFCAQDLAGSPLIAHYRAYFSDTYADLKQSIADTLAEIRRLHEGEAVAAFERGVRVWAERRQFWSRFCDLPEMVLDTADITRKWREAREAVAALLQAKQAAPLEPLSISEAATGAISAFEECRQQVAALNGQLQAANREIALVKERAAAGNRTALAADLALLKAVKARYVPETAALCTAYLDEKAAKAATEAKRDQARAALDQYRQTVFPAYQAAINIYLQRFNAGWRYTTLGELPKGAALKIAWPE